MSTNIDDTQKTTQPAKVTLIKQPRTPVAPVAPAPVQAAPVAPAEKKVVVVKKKVVVVKPTVTVTPAPVSPKPAQTNTNNNNNRPNQNTASKPVVPTRDGYRSPVIIKGKDLPPITPTAVPSSNVPRQAGVVGGKRYTNDKTQRPRGGQQQPQYGNNYRNRFNNNSQNQGQGGQQGQGGRFQRPDKPGFGNKPRPNGPNAGAFAQKRPQPGAYKPSGGGFARPSDDSNVGKNRRDYTGKQRSGKNQNQWDKEEDRESMMKYNKKKEQSSASAVPKSIDILENITVNDLAKKMNLKVTEIISKLMSMGQMVTINAAIDLETVELIAAEYGCEVHVVNLYDETVIPTEETSEDMFVPRAPIVTVMGHVDHGKTKLLDAIRQTRVAEGEFGGITQHIGAYKVNLPERGDVVFLDTPGHAAFTTMRARGAQITDIVVLVVAANDGVMPQTLEAIDHAKAAKVPIIVAINKCDLPEANPDRVMEQLSRYDLTPEEWGGKTLYCRISALKRLGIDDLLDTILLQAEMLELQAVCDCRAEATVLESRIDPGKGSVASLIIKKGTLKEGDHYVVGIYPGRVRAMWDDKGNRIKEAGPATPVEISGLSGLPLAGDPFQVTEDEKQARMVGAKRQELDRLNQQSKNSKARTSADLLEKIRLGKLKELSIIIKGDVQGSVEALKSSLEELTNEEIRISVIRASAGAIIENDITLASASENHAIVIGFNVRPTPKAAVLAEQEGIQIKKYNVIYDAVEEIKLMMEGLLAPEKTEVDIGKADIRNLFNVPKVGLIAGCYITEGSVKRNSFCRVIRDSYQINKELIKITSLKRLKDDVKEVTYGFECGIGILGFSDFKVGDQLEFVEIKEVKRTLEDVGKSN